VLGFFLLSPLGFTARAEDERPMATPVPVPVWKVHFQDQLSISSAWPATVIARRQSQLGFERGGLIASVLVDVGDQVLKDDKLASLNTITQQADLVAANAAATQARSARDIAKATANRQEKLAAAGHISSQRLEEIYANLAGADAAYQAALAQAKALQSRLSLSHILAPFSGTIIARHLDEGAIAGPGSAVLELVESDRLEVKTGLPIASANTLHRGDIVSLSFTGGQAKAKLRRSTKVIDPATQTVKLVFDLIPGDQMPVSGQSVRIHLQDHLNQRGFTVPLASLREGNRGLWSLYALTPNGKPDVYILAPVPVEILHADAETAFVRGPIKEGTMILLASAQNTSAGMRVAPSGKPGNE
jgi:RND family efflux transporter MFP subunit